jgi:uncharacterized protein YndB with AHSA1/START domain
MLRVIPSQIEKEILIDAPVDVVWRVVTEPDQMTRWFSERNDYELMEGAHGKIRMSARTTYNIAIEAIEPHKRFVFRWAHADGTPPDESNSMRVEFTFHPESGSTRLKVIESGFDTIDWSDEEKRSFFDGHDHGWPGLLDRLREAIQSEPS